MGHSAVYSETQRFDQLWVRVLMIGLILGLLASTINNLYFDDLIAFLVYQILPLAVAVMVGFLVFKTKLTTRIDKDGIYVRLSPLHFSDKFFSWNEIEQAYVRQYKPILEYGGWGLRGLGRNRAFNIKGNQGLQLVFRNGKRLLIGTQHPEQMNDLLKELGKWSKK
jgi:hypothetical protein